MQERLRKASLWMFGIGFLLGIQFGIQVFRITFPPKILFGGFMILCGIGFAVMVLIDRKRFPQRSEQ